MPRAVTFNPLLRRTQTNGDSPPPHPGEILREDYLAGPSADHALLIRTLAEKIDWPAEKLSAVVAEQQDITPDLAWRLGEALGTNARYWLALQLQFDLWHDQTAHSITGAPAIDCAF